ncbi:hypothetical protein QJS10_CPA01g00582 [Acorus calamus]|uniref:ETFB lysine methyltransferase n=1 Tax=Acorus calamus TaxID=4465 RepID=A0AAV9FNG5_ACOCL|nr:hypothetical protein QJS10_CPA01g00582 [Acorus calamus]
MENHPAIQMIVLKLFINHWTGKIAPYKDPHAKNIILNPGLAFGTGDHPTTKLCLLLLNESIKGGECILDYGTGSGILGIAALKLGAAFSVGVDIDPQAITSAHQNIVLNKIEPDKMQLYLVSHQGAPISPDGGTCNDKEEPSSCSPGLNIGRGKFDIVIANILLNPLVDLAKDIVAYAKPGAIIGLSGIITDQVPQVEKHYSQFLDGIRVSEMDGWPPPTCPEGTKRSRTCLWPPEHSPDLRRNMTSLTRMCSIVSAPPSHIGQRKESLSTNHIPSEQIIHDGVWGHQTTASETPPRESQHAGYQANYVSTITSSSHKLR